MIDWFRRRSITISGLGVVALFMLVSISFLVINPDPGLTQKKWIYQTIANPGRMAVDEAIYFARDVRDKTGGEITFDIYTGAGLGVKGSQVLRALGNRELEVANAYASHIGGDMPLAEVLNLPFILPCNSEVSRQVKQYMWPYWQLEFQKRNVRMLAAFKLDCRNVYTRDPVESLEDLQGLKIRTSGAVETEFTNAIGANAVTIEWNDLYSALQQGVVDGYWVSNGATLNAKLYEVANAAYEVQYSAPTGFVLMNLDAWKELSPQQQSIVRVAARNMEELVWARVTPDDQESRQELISEHGFTYHPASQSEIESMRQKAKPIWREWAEKVGPPAQTMIDRTRSIVENWNDVLE